MTSRACFGSIRTLVTRTPKKKVGHFVGGVLSPLLAHVALAGMERLFDADYAAGRPQAPASRQGSNRGRAVLRDADDFVITAPTREVWEPYARPRVEKLLEERGLARSAAPTRRVPSKERWNFLGFHLRKGGKQGKWLTVPHKAKVLKHVRAIRSSLDAQKPTPAGRVMKERNPVIRGWANYDRHWAAQPVCQKVRHAQGQRLWLWAQRRHPALYGKGAGSVCVTGIQGNRALSI